MRGRPRIELTLSEDPGAVYERFTAALADPDCPCAGAAGRWLITLRMHASRRRAWSPWLQLEVKEHSDGTVLVGTMGPQPELWAGFLFVYALLVFAWIGGTMYGLVELSLGWSPTGFWAAGAALSGLALACGLDLLGRRLGEGQMGVLRGFVERVARAPGSARTPAPGVRIDPAP
jgi:hypothetical protein